MGPSAQRAFVSWRTWQLKLALLAQPKSWVVDLLRGTFRGGSTTSPSSKWNPSEPTTFGLQGTIGLRTDGGSIHPSARVDRRGARSQRCRSRHFGHNVSRTRIPQTHVQHPVVRSSAPGTVWPLAIHVDGTEVSKLDSILGIFMVNIVTGSRHLVGTLRKTGICMCGCKGWCSIFCVTEFVKWSCLAMASGMWPTARHDWKPWRGDSDAARSQLAKHQWWFIGIVLRVRGDWAEYSSTLGFHICTACHCEHADMHQTSGFYRGLPRTMTVVDASGGSRCRVQPNTQMWLHILRGVSRIQGHGHPCIGPEGT